MKDLKFLKKNLIAHRGIHIDAPENSIKAFKDAVKNGYIIEFDVHLLKDNEVVVFHDDDLRRMTGESKKLKDCTYDDIKELTLLNTEYHIPTLDEVLKIVKGQVPIIVELKTDRLPGKLEKEVVKKLDRYEGDFCVKSFSPLSVRWFKKHKPTYIRGLLLDRKPRSFIDKISRSRLALSLARPDFLSCNYHLSDNKVVSKYKRKKHVPVIAWTIRNDLTYKENKDQFYNLIVDFDKKKD